MERFFQILAVILALVAAYFLWAGNRDAFFASAVFAAVSFFLSIRFQVKERNRIRDAERKEVGEPAAIEQETNSESSDIVDR
jgi:hypothetical protein